MLTGEEALARALTAERLRRAFAAPGAALPLRAELSTPVLSDAQAVVTAITGALLAGHPTAALVTRAGLPAALGALSQLATWNELRSPATLVELGATGGDDTRAALADLAMLPQLEGATPDELYRFGRLAARLSRRAGLPVLVRAPAAALAAQGPVAELPPVLADGPASFARSAGPYAGDPRYHRDKRARLLDRLEPLVEVLAQELGGDGPLGVVIAGHIAPEAIAVARARHLPVLRLGAAWPLPRARLLEFLRRRERVLVLEEGRPVLEERLLALAHTEGLGCRVQGALGAAAGSLARLADRERVDSALVKFVGPQAHGAARGAAEVPLRDAAQWRAAEDAITTLSDDDGEPWPLHHARQRAAVRRTSPAPLEPLLGAVRALDRPTLVIAPALAGAPRVDVELPPGTIAAAAAALAEAAEIEEHAGEGAPLPVAIVAGAAQHRAELPSVAEAALAGRELLLVVALGAGVAEPPTAAELVERQLRAAGVDVAVAPPGAVGLADVVAAQAARPGARAVVCAPVPSRAPGSPGVE